MMLVMAQNGIVIMKKLLMVLWMLCVVLAPVVNSAGMIAADRVGSGHEQNVDVHDDMPSDCHGMQEGGQDLGAQALHGCCVHIVGIALASPVPSLASVSHEKIPFHSSMSLISRAEGLFRPPRLHS